MTARALSREVFRRPSGFLSPQLLFFSFDLYAALCSMQDDKSLCSGCSTDADKRNLTASHVGVHQCQRGRAAARKLFRRVWDATS